MLEHTNNLQQNMFFQVSGNGASASHNAQFFIQGLFMKGEGQSFALPTVEPIMILRDPRKSPYDVYPCKL